MKYLDTECQIREKLILQSFEISEWKCWFKNKNSSLYVVNKVSITKVFQIIGMWVYSTFVAFFVFSHQGDDYTIIIWMSHWEVNYRIF